MLKIENVQVGVAGSKQGGLVPLGTPLLTAKLVNPPFAVPVGSGGLRRFPASPPYESICMPNIDVHIREATTNDIAAMHAIRLGVHENRLSDPNWLTYDVWSSCLAGCGRANTWVCDVDGTIVGFSVARIAEADIWALFVDPDAEGKGHGKRLLRTASDWLFAHGVAEIRLSTTVNTRADTFYRQQGWLRGELTPKGEVVYRLQDNRITQRAGAC